MSSTRLSAWIDGILEAGWLAAIIVTPLFFNIYSSRVFEPDKLTTLRSIAILMAALWLVRLVEEGVARQGRRSAEPLVRLSWRTPLMLPTLLTVVAYLISTALSITPYVSFFGSYQRLQGTFTTLSYIVIFLIVLERMRTRAQVDRFITTLILNSLPIALYGFVQHFERDPLPWGGDVVSRIASNMGNAIFVAAYLIMVAPPTMARIVDSFRSILTEEDSGIADILRAAAYIFIFLVQLIAIWFSRSRGPLMGLLFGLGVWGFASLIVFQQHRHQSEKTYKARLWLALWSAVLLIAILASVGFFLVNPGGPLHEWAIQQPWGRLANVLELEGGTGKVRALIWEGGLDLILPHEPIRFPATSRLPEGRADWANGVLRYLFGYGPESMYVAYNNFYPPLLGHFEDRKSSPDRSHNETLDSLIITGLTGFIAYLWLFGSIFYFGLRWLGIIPSDWRRILFFALLVGGAVGFVIWAVVGIGPHFLGLAIPIGMTIGLLVYLLIYGFHSSWKPEPPEKVHPNALLLIGILAAFVAHFVEINFGISIASTRTTFWTLAGVFVLLGLQQIAEREEVPAPKAAVSKDKRRRRRPAAPPAAEKLPTWLWPALGAALIGAFMLGTLAYDFINNLERLDNPLAIFWRSLAVISIRSSHCPSPPCTSLAILMVYVATWLAIALLTVTQMVKMGAFRQRKGEVWAAALTVLVLSLTVGVTFGLLLAGRHAHIVGVTVQSIPQAVKLAEYVAGQVTAYYLFLLVILLLGGLALMGERRIPKEWATFGGPLVALLFVVLVPFAVYNLNMRPIQADIVFKQGDPWERQEQWAVAVQHYQRAIELSPWQNEDFYYLYLGRALLEYASTLDGEDQDFVLRETERVLLQAQAINPLNTDHSANLARMYRRWADLPAGREQREYLAQLSSDYYATATMLSPNNAILWNEWAELYYYSLGDRVRYQETIDHSLEIDPEFEQTWAIIWKVLGNVYQQQEQFDQAVEAYRRSLEFEPRQPDVWKVLGDVYQQQEQFDQAVEAYRRSLEIEPRQPDVWKALGRVYLQLEQFDQAAEAFSQTIELGPNASDVWDAHRFLALSLYRAGQYDAAIAEAEMALQLAPDDQKATVQQMIAQMQQEHQPGGTNP